MWELEFSGRLNYVQFLLGSTMKCIQHITWELVVYVGLWRSHDKKPDNNIGAIEFPSSFFKKDEWHNVMVCGNIDNLFLKYSFFCFQQLLLFCGGELQ